MKVVDCNDHRHMQSRGSRHEIFQSWPQEDVGLGFIPERFKQRCTHCITECALGMANISKSTDVAVCACTSHFIRQDQSINQ